MTVYRSIGANTSGSLKTISKTDKVYRQPNLLRIYNEIILFELFFKCYFGLDYNAV